MIRDRHKRLLMIGLVLFASTTISGDVPSAIAIVPSSTKVLSINFNFTIEAKKQLQFLYRNKHKHGPCTEIFALGLEPLQILALQYIGSNRHYNVFQCDGGNRPIWVL